MSESLTFFRHCTLVPALVHGQADAARLTDTVIASSGAVMTGAINKLN
jgi:hypothetical protein